MTVRTSPSGPVSDPETLPVGNAENEQLVWDGSRWRTRRGRSYAQANLQGNHSNPIPVAGEFVPLGGTFNLTNIVDDFDMPQNGRLRYFSPRRVLCTVNASISFSGTLGNLIAFQMARNGNPQVRTEVLQTILQGGGAVHAVQVTALVRLGTDDFVEIHVTNQSSTDPVVVRRCCLVVEGGPQN